MRLRTRTLAASAVLASACACPGPTTPAGAGLPRCAVATTALGATDAVLLGGRRAAVEVLLRQDRIGRAAFAPLDALRGLQLVCEPPLVQERVAWTPAGVEKVGRAGTLQVRTTWGVDAARPLLRVQANFRNDGAAEATVHVAAVVAANVGWINKFVPHDDDLAAVDGDAVRFCDAAHPELQVVAAMTPAAEAVVLGAAPAAPGAQAARLVRTLVVPAGGAVALAITVAGSDRNDELGAATSAAPLRAFGAELATACSFDCPEPELDEFVRAAAAWPWANVRELPFGPPFDPDGRRNARWPVLTASPDYHGVFANDCVQSLWELGLLGPAFAEVAQHTVDCMFRFGPKESVEWWTGDGRVWCFPAPLGDTPQLVMGACWHLLWTGDRDLAARWWPDLRRCLDVLAANDADGDGLEDRPNTPYPEQPDPGRYDHEMLYVQCFWHQAFLRAAAVATWLGRDDAAALAQQADRIRAAIAARFATPYGLAVWLDRDHHPHPHLGHEAVIAAAEGDVAPAIAARVIHTAMQPPVWTDDGPLRAEPGKGVAAGDHVWGFLRWKLVHALFRAGDPDRALDLARRWAVQERGLFYQAPEGFPTITGTTGKGYTWTAARALRALVFGLSGLDLDGEGVVFAPQLPSAWDHFALRGLDVHGTRLDLVVRRGPAAVCVDGRRRATPRLGYGELRGVPVRIEVWVP